MIFASDTSSLSLALEIASLTAIEISALWSTTLTEALPPEPAASNAFARNVITQSPETVEVSTALPEYIGRVIVIPDFKPVAS